MHRHAAPSDGAPRQLPAQPAPRQPHRAATLRPAKIAAERSSFTRPRGPEFAPQSAAPRRRLRRQAPIHAQTGGEFDSKPAGDFAERPKRAYASPQVALTASPDAFRPQARQLCPQARRRFRPARRRIHQAPLPSAKADSAALRRSATRRNRRLRFQQVRQAQVRQAKQAPRPRQRQDRKLRTQAFRRRPSLFQGAQPAGDRGFAKKPGGFTGDRKYSKGPGKPSGYCSPRRRFQTRSGAAISNARRRLQAPSSDFKRPGGDFKRSGEGRPAARPGGFGKSFGADRPRSAGGSAAGKSRASAQSAPALVRLAAAAAARVAHRVRLAEAHRPSIGTAAPPSG